MHHTPRLVFCMFCLSIWVSPLTAEPLDMSELLPKEETASPTQGTPATETDDPVVSIPAPATSQPEQGILVMPTPPPAVAITLPGRGMKKHEVESKFGNPLEKVEAIGEPPISRWVYDQFTVYFEHDTVLHAVVPKTP